MTAVRKYAGKDGEEVGGEAAAEPPRCGHHTVYRFKTVTVQLL